MRIDIHTHTRKVKGGDAQSRNIEKDKFEEIIKSTDVKILAITNHNLFDLEQFKEFRDAVITNCQIWPGIELDIFQNNKRAHLLVICNPKNCDEFKIKVDEILAGEHPDSFKTKLETVVEKFDELDCIYVAHYFVKKPDLGDEELGLLSSLVSNPKRIIKEATNAISAGIYVSHGHNSIYGSDVHDWDKYIEHSKFLPELRLPVESFEQFCLLLEKDEATINTLLNKKVKETIEIVPFSVAEKLSIDIYNDINILFGSKGTGKTEILEALSKYYNSRGHRTHVYKSNDTHLNDTFDIKGASFNCNVSDFGLDECEEEIKFLKEVEEEEITSLNKYFLHFSVAETNKISQKLKIKNIPEEDDGSSDRLFIEMIKLRDKFKEFKEYVLKQDQLKSYVAPELIDQLIGILEKIQDQLIVNAEYKFIEHKSILLLNSLVSIFLNEISKKTGQPPKPRKTGFADFSRKRIEIELAIRKIQNNLSSSIQPQEEYAGSLGEKGELKCITNIKIQDGTFTDGTYTPVKSVRKAHQKNVINAIKAVRNHIYTVDLFSKISELNEVDGVETINNLSDLLLKYKHFCLGESTYSPSNGESSMILLHKELREDKEIFLIDEPEKSLGNDYINDVIVPLLKEKALLGKKIIIATHDANIAVRTLPYNSIYRLHDQGLYFTMIGNPFINSLRCIYDSRSEMDWKQISMKTLEGGQEAFGERGKIYGN